jgi:hypothetical protein
MMWVNGGYWQMRFAARYVALKMLKYDRMANGDVSILDTDRERIADECADHILRGQDKFDPARDFQNWAWEVAENKMKNLWDRSDEVLDHAERNLQPKMGQDEHNREEALVADDSTASADTQAMKNWERGERGGGGGDSRSVVDVIRDDVKLRFAYSLCRKPGNVHERRMALYCANYYFLRTRQHLDELLAKVNDRRRKASFK